MKMLQSAEGENERAMDREEKIRAASLRAPVITSLGLRGLKHILHFPNMNIVPEVVEHIFTGYTPVNTVPVEISLIRCSSV